MSLTYEINLTIFMKIPTLLLGVLAVFILSCTAPLGWAAAGDFPDISPSHPNYQAIMSLKNSGVVEGFKDGLFRPNQFVTRVEALKFIILGSDNVVQDMNGTGGFIDTDPKAWYAKYLIHAVQLGIIHGYYDGTFRPHQVVSLAENLKMSVLTENIDISEVVVTHNPYDDVSTDEWYIRYVQYAKEKNIIEADGLNKVYPTQGMTRAQLAETLYRLQQVQKVEQNPPGNILSAPEPMPVPVQTPTSSGLSLQVAGNQLIDAQGKTVRLLGVNRSGQEFKCIQSGTPGSLGWGLFDGPTDLASAQAIVAWHANTVRLPLNEDCWLGINGVNPQWGGPAYQEGIKNYVNTLHQAGLYVILDLHWNSPGTIPAAAQQPMPDADHAVDFWKSVATTFGSDQGVVFDLYNEPFLYGSYMQNPNQDPWDCWLNGCGLNQYLTGGQPYTQSYLWNAVGMQTLVNTVRATGAKNVIMVGGLEWSNDLTGWLAHKPVDPQNSLVVSWHSYSAQSCKTVACWDAIVGPIATQVPIIIGEVGDSICNSADYLPTLLPWANKHGLSYLGWTWNTWGDCDNVLIKDYDGTPTNNYGQTFKDLLMSANP